MIWATYLGAPLAFRPGRPHHRVGFGRHFLYCDLGFWGRDYDGRWRGHSLSVLMIINAVITLETIASWGLMDPLIILGGIFSGVFTPSESAVDAVNYAILGSLFV
ncbi:MULTISPECIES: hypothetical protein [Falsihalocynthiibacter]|uniref:hypothetical protein n=1 Tax=Falsihalocynthiibacter TaxID=2854182 RepID=UPI0030039BD0